MHPHGLAQLFVLDTQHQHARFRTFHAQPSRTRYKPKLGTFHFGFSLTSSRFTCKACQGTGYIEAQCPDFRRCAKRLKWLSDTRNIQSHGHALQRSRTNYSSPISTLHRFRSTASSETTRQQLPLQLSRQNDQPRQRQQD